MCGNNESIKHVEVGSGKPLVLSIPHILELSEKVAASYRCLPKASEFNNIALPNPITKKIPSLDIEKIKKLF